MAEICITHTRAVSLGPHRFFFLLLLLPAALLLYFIFPIFVVKGNNKIRRRKQKNLGARVERTVDCNKSNIGQSGRSFIRSPLVYSRPQPVRYYIGTYYSLDSGGNPGRACKASPTQTSQTVQSQWMAAWVQRGKKIWKKKWKKKGGKKKEEEEI